jgi:hypothetical protein
MLVGHRRVQRRVLTGVHHCLAEEESTPTTRFMLQEVNKEGLYGVIVRSFSYVQQNGFAFSVFLRQRYLAPRLSSFTSSFFLSPHNIFAVAHSSLFRLFIS